MSFAPSPPSAASAERNAGMVSKGPAAGREPLFTTSDTDDGLTLRMPSTFGKGSLPSFKNVAAATAVKPHPTANGVAGRGKVEAGHISPESVSFAANTKPGTETSPSAVSVKFGSIPTSFSLPPRTQSAPPNLQEQIDLMPLSAKVPQSQAGHHPQNPSGLGQAYDEHSIHDTPQQHARPSPQMQAEMPEPRGGDYMPPLQGAVPHLASGYPQRTPPRPIQARPHEFIVAEHPHYIPMEAPMPYPPTYAPSGYPSRPYPGGPMPQAYTVPAYGGGYYPAQGYRPQMGYAPMAPPMPMSAGFPPTTYASPSTAPSTVSPAPPKQSRKLQIINPETGEEVKIESVPKINKPLSVSSEGEAAAAASRRTIVITNPDDNSEVNLSSLVQPKSPLKKAEPVEAAVVPMVVVVAEPGATEEPAAVPELHDDFSQDDVENIFSSAESGSEQLASEEEEPAPPTGPVILKRGQQVLYPRTRLQFTPPAEGEAWRYTRGFLLQFKDICRENLANIKIELPSAPREQRPASHHGGGGDRRPPRPSHHQQKSSSTSRRANARATVEEAYAALTNRNENAWKPAASTAGLDETDKILREAKGLLNKLTEAKFDAISDKILALGITAEGVMKGMIELVFDKAVEEVKYAPMYARLCRKIVETEVAEESKKLAPEERKDAKIDSRFRRLLITKCQYEYELKRAWSTQRLERLRSAQEAKESSSSSNDAAVNGGTTTTTATSQESSEKAEEAPSKPKFSGQLTEDDYILIKLKRRVLGNVRFIGELYRQNLISEKIMHGVIRELLSNCQSPEEEEIESLCRLVSTVGSALDIPQAANHWSAYITRMQSLVTNPQLPSRVRFMVLDVLDQRKNRWQAKVEDVQQTLEQRQREQEPSSSGHHDHRPVHDRDRDRDYRYDDRRPPAHRGEAVKYYSTSSGAAHALSRPTILSRPREPERERPPQSGGRTTWLQSSGPRPVAERGRPSLTRTEDINRPSSAASSASSGHINRFQALNEADAADGAATPTAERRLDEDTWQEEEHGADFTEDSLKKIVALFEEFVGTKRIEDLLAEIRSAPAAHHQRIMARITNYALDRGMKGVSMFKAVVAGLVQEKVVDGSAVVAGFKEALEMIDDLAVDIPSVYEWAGILLANAHDVGVLKISDISLHILDGVAGRDQVPVAKTIVHAIAASETPRALLSAELSAAKDALEPFLTCSPAIKSLIQKLAISSELMPWMEMHDFSARLNNIKSENFFADARIVAADFAEAKDGGGRAITQALMRRAFEHIHGQSDWAKQVQGTYVPALLMLLSPFKYMQDSWSLEILNVLTADYQASDVEFFETFFRELLAAGIVPVQVYRAWREDTSIDKRTALFRVSKWLDANLPAESKSDSGDDDDDGWGAQENDLAA